MRRLSRNLVGMLIMLVLLVLILIGVYAIGARYYRAHFFSGASINGVDVGGMTVDEAKYQIQDRIREYALVCKERSSQVESITGSQIYMQYVDDGTIDQLMEDQNELFWPFAFVGGGRKYTADIGFTYDKNSIEPVMDQMRCFQTEFVVAPHSAQIAHDGINYYVEESTEGSQLNYDATKEALMRAIEAGDTEIDFDALDLYMKPKLATQDAVELQAKADELNAMLATNVTYDFVDREYTVDRAVVQTFIREDEDGILQLNEEAIAQWVYDMAYETDTFGMSRDFRTTSGRTIHLTFGGDYGWVIHQEKTTEALIAAVRSGQQGELVPEYVYTAVDRSSNDIGDTYAEVCLEEQRMWFYKDGVLVVDTPVVTGDHPTGFDTPSGHVWAIDSMRSKEDVDMGGKPYRIQGVTVNYWIAFNGDCGIHDASWRKNWSSNAWQSYGGSHGCVNTPEDAVKKIYKAMYPGFAYEGLQYPVVVYYSLDQPEGPEPTQAVSVG